MNSVMKYALQVLLVLVYLLLAGAISLSALTTFVGKRRSLILGIIAGIILTALGVYEGLIFAFGLYLVVACSIIEYQKYREKMGGLQKDETIIARRKGAISLSVGGIFGFHAVLFYLLVTNIGYIVFLSIAALLCGYGAYKWRMAEGKSADMSYDRMMYKRRLAGIIILLGIIAGIFTLAMGMMMEEGDYVIGRYLETALLSGGVIVFSVVYGAHRWHRAVHEERIHSVERKDRSHARPTMTCPHCGAQLKRKVKFCPKCGEKIGESEYGH